MGPPAVPCSRCTPGIALGPTKRLLRMSYDKNVSPVGWYIGSYLLRFVELDDPH